MTENEDDYDPWDNSCANTDLPREECRCLDCWLITHRFKWICSDCKTIDDIIEVLKEKTTFFEKLKEEGWRVGGPIEDDYMELEPPIRNGYYWHHCTNCHEPVLVPVGVKIAPERCNRCESSGVVVE